jgi:hypothetical protein
MGLDQIKDVDTAWAGQATWKPSASHEGQPEQATVRFDDRARRLADVPPEFRAWIPPRLVFMARRDRAISLAQHDVDGSGEP